MTNTILGVRKLICSLPCSFKHSQFIPQRTVGLKRLFYIYTHVPQNCTQVCLGLPLCDRPFSSRSSSPAFHKESVVPLDTHHENIVVNNAISGIVHKDNESTFNHCVLENLSAYSGTVYKDDTQFLDTYKLGDNECTQIFSSTNWDDRSPHDIITSFISLGVHLSQKQNYLSIEDQQFDGLISALVKKLPLCTDAQLADCFIGLRYWPIVDYNSSHYLNLWKALDGVCLERYLDWTVDKSLFMMDLWFHLRLTKLSLFVFKGLNRISRKTEEMTAAQLIHSLFIMSCTRKLHPSIAIREYEYHIQRYITQLSIEEIGIFAVAFFKTKSTILNKKLLIYVMQRVVEEVETIPSVTLSGIAKVLRLSHKPEFGFTANDFVSKVMDRRLDTLSLTNGIHLTHIGTKIQFYNEDVLTKLAEKFCKNPSEARLKEMERIAFFLSLYNFIPPTTPDICQIIVEQLDLPVHIKASEEHALTFISLIYYLSLLQVFPEKQIRQVIDEPALLKRYTNKFYIPHQVVHLDYNRVLEGPPGSKHLLPGELREYLARKHCIRIPEESLNKKYDFGNCLWEVMQVTTEVLGKENHLVTYPLPHHPRPDILFRLDVNGNPLPIPEEVRNQRMFEGVYRPTDPKGWYCAVVCGRNMYMNNVPKLVGEHVTKLRQLKLLGYTPIMIPDYYWKAEKDKAAYLKLKLFSHHGENK